ncbi:MAG TPA: 16S rRNA (guanine(527)-N(7))-methyltransferase RsmG [Aquabacterium sp.]|nr:16S rRNA (guanine(527)-N(7))-methyltransferase RsmG [Aquabacterium sp.]
MQHPLWSPDEWLARIPAVLGSTGLIASDAQQLQLARYMALLQRWNGTYNLTALRAPEEMLSHHLADCLVVVAPLRQHLGLMTVKQGGDLTPEVLPATRQRVLDVGSGGGLPGVVLAILCPSVQVTCVDTVGKKAAFIRQVGAELALPNLRAEHARVEQLKGQYEVITSRAFASLVDFTDWTAHLLAPGAWWMAMKGRSPDDEMTALQARVRVDRIDPLVVPGLDAERCLVWMQPLA